MKYWCGYFVDLKQNSRVIRNPITDEEFEKYCTVFEYYTTRRLHEDFFVFLVFQDRLDRKKSQQMLLQLTVDLINKGSLRREFCINGIICSSAIQFLSTTGKKTHKAKTPNPVLLNCTTEYLKKGNVNAFFYNLDYKCFSQMYPFLKGRFS